MMFILAMVLATQVSRLAPLALGRVQIPKEFERWLTHVPIGILTALVIPEFFGRSAPEALPSWNTLFLGAGFLCLVVGAIRKNLLLTTFVGIVSVAIARGFFGF